MSILWTEDPGGLQSTGSQRVKCDWARVWKCIAEGWGKGRLLGGGDILAESWGACIEVDQVKREIKFPSRGEQQIWKAGV